MTLTEPTGQAMPERRKHRRAFVFPVALILFGCLPAAAMGKERPHIVVVLADDLGYGDLGCYGHPRIQTPRLDRFAKTGLRLTACYSAAPNCSPARAGLLTGRTPTRVGIYNWIPTYCPMHLRRSEVTIAKLLQQSGYQTCHVGKWHLSGALDDAQQPQPNDHGFDHWFATQNNALPNHANPVNFFRNGKPAGPLQGYSAPLVAAEATRWLENSWDHTSPFFLFVCFHEPHEPIATDPKYAKPYQDADATAAPSLAPHHGNVSQLDAGFGILLDTLERLQVRDKTLVWFTSDNGPAITSIHPHGSAGPFREKKGYVYEGGIRVPGIIQWPGVIEQQRTSDAPVSGVDLLPTLCEIAGVTPPEDRKLDGQSVAPLLRGELAWQRNKPLYWQFHRARGDIRAAMRDGSWKIVAQLTSATLKPSGGIEPGETEALKQASLRDFRLYHLQKDIGERTDVSSQHPEVFARLKTKMQRIHADVQREQPIWPAWEWPKYESKQIVWPAYRQRRQPSKPKKK